jgi:hypothetical protein
MDGAHARRDEFSAVSGGQDYVAILDLAFSRLAPQLADRFRHPGQVAEMIAGQ